MISRWEIVGAFLTCISFVVLLLALLIRSLHRSEDPPKLLFKFILSGLILGGGGWFVFSLPYGYRPLASIPFALALGIIWAPSIGTILARPLTSMFDGGSEEPEARPFYSIAEAKRKKGQFTEAVQEVRKQLEKFPGDSQGMLLLASIQAEDLNDLQGAQLTIERLLAQKGLPPPSFVSALHLLADWHTRYAQDQEAARGALERIIEKFPDTPYAQTAAQRIAHLATVEQLLQGLDPEKIVVPQRERHIGLRVNYRIADAPPELSAEEQAAAYVKQLEEHPMDTETREKLALLYAEQFQRLDLAVDQLEQLIALPNESPRRIARWLNLRASLHTRFGNDWVSAEQCLKRIIERFPGTAPAEMAQTRLAYLKLELKGNEKSQAKQLGSYEKDLGLKKPGLKIL